MGESQSPHVRRLASRVVYRNDWMTVREDDVVYSDGTRSIYGVIDKRDFAIVVAEQDGAFHLVEQYRYAIQQRSLEFPMGGWPAHGSGSSLELAQLELEEETGLSADTWRHLGHFAQGVGHSSQGFDVFHATGLVAGPHRRESTESDMEHRTVSEDELRALIVDGNIVDSHTVAAYTLFTLHRERS